MKQILFTTNKGITMKKLLLSLLLVPTMSMASITNWQVKVSMDEFSGQLESFELVSTADDGTFRPSKLHITKTCGGNVSISVHPGDNIKAATVMKMKGSKGKLHIYDVPNSFGAYLSSLALHNATAVLNDLLVSNDVKFQTMTRKGLKTILFPLGSFKPLFNLFDKQCK